MIRDFLIAELAARMPDRSFSPGKPPGAVVTFPAAHPDVGDLAIYDDGDEARIEFTKITHGHFGCWDESLSQSQREKDVAESVANFVEQVFAEKVILFSLKNNRGGGWQMLPEGNRSNLDNPLKR
jgi:hypothetical protein